MSIELTNGFRLLSGEWLKFDSIRIADGLIVGIDGEGQALRAERSIDVDGAKVFPGLIDLNVSLREPGFHMKGTVASETSAAAAGGVTTLCSTPDTDPVNDSEAVTKLIEELAHKSAKCRVLPLGALTKGLKGELLAEFAALKEAGCIALSNGYHPIKNLSITKRCFEYAKSQNLSVFVNPIEPSLYEGVMHEGVMSTTIGLQGISPLAETIPVAQLIQLAKSTGVHLHLSQLSAAGSVEQLRLAKQDGINVTAGVAVQNLLFTDENIVDFDSVFHCAPPIRGRDDREALLEAVAEGVIDVVTSSHQPHEAAAKLLPFAETELGMSSVELLLPIASRLSNNDELPLEKFINAMTASAASVLGQKLPAIALGETADICVFDDQKEWTVTESELLSVGKNTALLSKKVKGRVTATICAGALTHILG